MNLEQHVLPNNLEAEQMTIGSVLAYPQAFDDLRGIVGEDDFYHHHHGRIWEIITAITSSGKPVNLVSVFEEAMQRKWQEDVKADYLLSLFERVGVGANAEYYANVVREKATARRLIALCTEMIRDAYAGEPIDMLVSRFETQVFSVNSQTEAQSLARLQDLAREVIQDIDDREKPNAVSRFIRTPLERLNNVIGGLHPGRLIVLAARPSIGKSAFALNLAIHAAENENTPSLVFSLEMSPIEWAQRALAYKGSVPLNMITGATRFDQSQSGKILHAGDKLTCPVWIDRRVEHTVDTIAATVRRAIRRHKVGCVFVDFLGLIEPSGKHRDNKATWIGEITRSLKLLARSTDIPIVLLCQLNRELRGRSDGEPVLTDLRDSGSIEQDADDVIFLWTKPGAQNTETDQELWVTVAKQRNGPRCNFSVTYRRPYIQFLEREYYQ